MGLLSSRIKEREEVSAKSYETILDAGPPVFIGGSGRSGTSLVRTILNSHSNLSVGVELKITPIIAKAFAESGKQIPILSEHFHLSRRYLEESYRDLILRLLYPYWKRTGRLRIGEKTPNNVFHFKELGCLFTEAHFIHVVRDGRDVVRSLLKQDWKGPNGQLMPINQDPARAAGYWKQAVQAGQQAARQGDLSGRYVEVRYEELVREPESVLRSLFAFIGEPWEPAVLTFHEQGESVYPSVQRKITPRSVGRWQDGLDGAQKKAVKQVAGDLLIELEYTEDWDW